MMKWLKIAGIMMILVVIDQLVKLATLANLKDQEPYVLIRGVLELRYLENRGAAFGMFQNMQWLFLIITGIVIIALIWIIPHIPEEHRFLLLKGCLIFLGAGAIGNMIDRILRHYVVDMIYFRLIDFPVFNVADIYVTVSMFIMILSIFFYYKEEDLDRIFHLKKEV